MPSFLLFFLLIFLPIFAFCALLLRLLGGFLVLCFCRSLCLPFCSCRFLFLCRSAASDPLSCRGHFLIFLVFLLVLPCWLLLVPFLWLCLVFPAGLLFFLLMSYCVFFPCGRLVFPSVFCFRFCSCFFCFSAPPVLRLFFLLPFSLSLLVFLFASVTSPHASFLSLSFPLLFFLLISLPGFLRCANLFCFFADLSVDDCYFGLCMFLRSPLASSDILRLPPFLVAVVF